MCVNTDESYSPGEHWIGIFIPSHEHVEYYDSLGVWPPVPAIAKYLSNFANIHYNYDIPIQSPLESTCGLHVIYFLHRRCSGVSMKEIIKELSQMSKNPDVHVRNYILKYVIFSPKHYK
jgi:hypothetical protein